MKTYLKILFSLITFFSVIFLYTGIVNHTFATSGCCSWHDGVCGCGSNGRQICCDGQYSPTCTCTPTQPVNNQNTFYTLKQCVDKYNQLVNDFNKQLESYNQSEQLLGKCSLETVEYEKMLEQKDKDINNLKEIRNWLIGFLIFTGIWIIYLYYENRDK